MADDITVGVETPWGSVAKIEVNWNKFTLDPAVASATGKQLITDLDDFIDGMIAEIPALLGTRLPYHDSRDPQTTPPDLAAQKTVARAKPRMTMPIASFPPINKRFNALRFDKDAGGNPTGIIDDQKITTEQEVVDAIVWDQGNAIAKPDASRNAAERKLAAGRPDLLTETETDDVVVRWRGSGKAPPESSFVPPADRIRPQPPPRRGR